EKHDVTRSPPHRAPPDSASAPRPGAETYPVPGTPSPTRLRLRTTTRSRDVHRSRHTAAHSTQPLPHDPEQRRTRFPAHRRPPGPRGVPKGPTRTEPNP